MASTRGARQGCDLSPRKASGDGRQGRHSGGGRLGSATPGSIYTGTKREATDSRRQAEISPSSPHPKLSPEEAACVLIEGDRSICTFLHLRLSEGSLHQTWLFLDVFLPVPGRVGG